MPRHAWHKVQRKSTSTLGVGKTRGVCGSSRGIADHGVPVEGSSACLASYLKWEPVVDELPREFAEPAAQGALSFNGQLHFKCGNCHEISWADVKYGKSVLSGAVTPRCPNCETPRLQLIKFDAHGSVVSPPFPKRLFVLPQGPEPFGESIESDVHFLAEYFRTLQRSPEAHAACVHFVRFIESVFDQVYGATEAATDLLNLASGIMRTRPSRDREH